MMRKYKFNSKVKITLLIVILTFTSTCYLKATEVVVKDLYLNNIFKEKGIPASRIETIVQDNLGYLWFGYEGFTRFDGENLSSYPLYQDDSTSINSFATSAQLDPATGKLWIGTSNGLFMFDPEKNSIRNFFHIFPSTIGSEYINDLCIIDNENIMVGTISDGAYLFNKEFNTIVCLSSREQDLSTLRSNNVRKIIKDSRGEIWLGTDNGLEHFDYLTNTFTHFLTGNDIRDIEEDRNGKLWITTYDDNFFYVFDPVFKKVITKFDLPELFKEKHKQFVFDKEGQIWLGVLDRGLFIINPLNKNEISLVNNKNDEANSTIKFLLNIEVDVSGNIWMSTLYNGIYLYNKDRKPFRLAQNNNLSLQYNLKGARSIFQDRDGQIWVGARNASVLSEYNIDEDRFTDYTLPVGNENAILDDLILTICDGKKGEILIGTVHNGVFVFNKKTKEFKRLFPDNNKPKTVYGLLKDGDDIWIGYDLQGVEVFNVKTGESRFYTHSNIKNSLTVDYINHIYKDNDGDIWISTIKGLNKYNKSIDGFQRYLSNLTVRTTFQDREGNIWAGTNGGLYLKTADDDNFKRIGTENEIAGSKVLNILEDNGGNLWFNIEKGIVKYDKIHDKIWSFSKGDGLQDFIFFQSAYALNNGDLMFGGSNGITLFTPFAIKKSDNIPDTHITDLKIFNESVAVTKGGILDKQILFKDSIQLSYKHRVFSFEYSSLDYGGRTNVEYAYRLIGFDDRWNFVGDRKTATYTNLSPGTYTFEVKACNNDGVWSETPRKLYIQIKPPFWRTWYAYSAYILLIFFLVFQYQRYVFRRHLEMRKKEMDEEKLKLFVNISHEFRTPLTLMLNPLRDIMDIDKDGAIHVLASKAFISVQKLLNLVNQLQAFRRIDFKKSPLNVEECEISEFVESVVYSFADLANKKDLILISDSKIEGVKAYIDKDKLEKVLNNLISNAIKYTNKGEVRVVVDFDSDNVNKPNNKKLKIEVHDTGIGLKKDQLRGIFERFYQTDLHNVGAGIGLNYVKSLVELHKGKISVKSEYEIGSTFTIILPCNKSSYSESEIIKLNSSDSIFEADQTVLDALDYDISASTGIINDFDNKDDKRAQSILLVEDNKALINQLKDFFDNKFKVYTAYNGKEGLDKVKRYMPDLIISDVMMPEMDGLEFCKELKSDIDTCHIPVILLTAKGMVEDQIEGFGVGADEYIPKPFYMEFLDKRVANILENRRILKEKFKEKSILANVIDESNLQNKDELFLDKITKIILDNIENSDLSIKDIHTEIGIGSTHFYNKITKLTGYSPSSFIRNVRVKCGAEMLAKGETSIKEVCYSVGFSSPPYFAKCFKELYSMTPTEYVNKNKQENREA